MNWYIALWFCVLICRDCVFVYKHLSLWSTCVGDPTTRYYWTTEEQSMSIKTIDPSIHQPIWCSTSDLWLHEQGGEGQMYFSVNVVLLTSSEKILLRWAASHSLSVFHLRLSPTITLLITALMGQSTLLRAKGTLLYPSQLSTVVELFLLLLFCLCYSSVAPLHLLPVPWLSAVCLESGVIMLSALLFAYLCWFRVDHYLSVIICCLCLHYVCKNVFISIEMFSGCTSVHVNKVCALLTSVYPAALNWWICTHKAVI